MERARLVYHYNNGIMTMEKPQMTDLSLYTEIEFHFDQKNCYLEINKGVKMPIIDGICNIKIKALKKGTNTLRLVGDDFVIPCQPLDVFTIGDALKCDVACSLDVIKLANDLQDKVSELKKENIDLKGRLEKIESLHIEVIIDKINSIIEAINTLAERVNELEKGFDPTLV